MLGAGDPVVTCIGIITSPLAPENVWSKRTDIRQTIIYFLCISYLLHVCVCVCVCVCVFSHVLARVSQKNNREEDREGKPRKDSLRK